MAAICSGLAALLHLVFIFWGDDGYRFFGAGEAMAQMVEAGALYSTLVTLGITFIYK
ncbi:hypothetical protein [uncultured Shewanella sp.]|uniref:hypothetical protein n=1 Tax=uncultured Shewanella sp. TaxID=173975 RepID=UPI00262F3F73|nr:hypothetical protein [uncultured Shewanella sp.]